MSKQNKILWRALGVLVIALLISLCFLGSTFARYTSTASGTGGVEVAKWTITGEAQFSTSAEAKITPSKEAYDGSTYTYDSNPRKNTSGFLYSLLITNESNVKATISDLEPGSISFYDDQDTEITTLGYDVSSTDPDYIANASYNQYITTYAKKMFSVKLFILLTYDEIYDAYSSTYDDVISACTVVSNTYYYLPVDSVYATSFTTLTASQDTDGNTLEVYSQVTWTSDLDSTCNGDIADFIDTWIGKSVSYIKFDVTCDAVQASQHTNGGVVDS